MKRRLLWIFAAALAAPVMAVVVWMGALYANHDSLSFHSGSLAVNDPFLDGSGDVFQCCTWHLGDGTRTWGKTYGVKILRRYVTVEVQHVHPHRTPAEAREDE